MIVGGGALVLIVIAWWFIWSKLCDIEQKQFRMHNEMSLSLKHLEEQLHLMQSTIERMDENIPPVPQSVKDVWRERGFLDEYE